VLAVGERGLVEELRGAGYDVTPAVESRTRPGDDGRFDACIVGLDRGFDYPRLTAAMGAILGGARFIATNADRWYPDERGLLPGAGAMVAAIAAAARRRPRVIGKPAPEMFALILEAAGVRATEALVIGDNPDADILAARRAGIPSVLVLTGVADAAAAQRLRADRRPDHVLAGPAAVGELLRALVSRTRPSAPRPRAPRPRAARPPRAGRSRGGRR
jgi:ribonucleotide monophosphatase NagD (HAD superfamily)